MWTGTKEFERGIRTATPPSRARGVRVEYEVRRHERETQEGLLLLQIQEHGPVVRTFRECHLLQPYLQVRPRPSPASFSDDPDCPPTDLGLR